MQVGPVRGSHRAVTKLKTKSAELIRKARETGQPIIITQNGEAKAVLQSLSDYENLQESLAMLKLVAMSKESVARGRTKPLRKAFSDIRKEAKTLRDKA